MIATQYSFVLPADYEMSVIDQRIRDKGPLLDGYPGLRFKAYLSARKQDDRFANTENLYAPFYLWDDSNGLNNFVAGPGFAGVAEAFGWPSIRTFIVWHAEFGEHLADAKYACREISPIAAYSDLATLRAETLRDAQIAVQEGALVAVVGIDSATWELVRFHLYSSIPTARCGTAQWYAVGHMSLP